MAILGRPADSSLKYYTADVNRFEIDEKMLELNNEYGPLGEAVWERILCMIYQSKQGYYYKFKSIDNVALMLVKSIGSKWVSKEKAVEIIRYLSESELLCKHLVSENVMTSTGIQKRWRSAMIAMKRRRCIGEEYWILGDTLLNDAENDITSEEIVFSYEVMDVSYELSTQKERKRKEIKLNKMIITELEENKICVGLFKDILILYYEEFEKTLNPYEISKLIELIKEYDLDPVINAIRESIFNHKNDSVKYVEGILKNTSF